MSHWWWRLRVGKTVDVWEKGVYGNSFFSAQFCCESKTALKTRLLKQNKTKLENQWMIFSTLTFNEFYLVLSFECFVYFVFSLLWKMLDWENIISQLPLRYSRMCSSSQLRYLTFSLSVLEYKNGKHKCPRESSKHLIRKSVEKILSWLLGCSGWFEMHMRND